MSKTKEMEAGPAEPLPGEFGPITTVEWDALPEEVKRRRMKRAYERLQSLRGKVHLNIDIDELRGRNR